MDPCPVVSCCLQVGWAVWRVHRQGQDAVHTGIPESFAFLLEQGVKYSGALIPPTLRGLRHYIASAPLQLNLSLILLKEKVAQHTSISGMGWLQSSL